ncbi:hypothetical protein Tco_1085843 [Tanacetum coccineum]
MRRKRVNKEAEANAPPKVLRKDHASGPTHSNRGGKSIAAIGLDAGSTFSPPAAQNTPIAVSDLEPLSYAKPQPHPVQAIAQSSKGAADEIPTEDVATTEVNVQLSMGSPNSEKSTSPSVGRMLKKAIAKISRRDQKIQAREEEIKKLDEEIRSLRTVETKVHGLCNRTQNLETLLEAEVDMKKVAEAKSVDLAGEERIKAAFEEFKKSEDAKVEQRCAEMDARLDAMSINFDEDLYPHILTAIAGRLWVIGHGLRLAIMKCAESTELRVEQGEAKLDLAAIKAYDPEAEAKYVAALTALGDLKYPLVDQLDKLRDAPINLLMASLHLESDSGEDSPEWIRELRLGTSQFKIPIYPEVRNPRDPWSFQEKKKMSSGVPFSHPTGGSVQTKASEDEASLRLLRSNFLPPMYNLDWP